MPSALHQTVLCMPHLTSHCGWWLSVTKRKPVPMGESYLLFESYIVKSNLFGAGQ